MSENSFVYVIYIAATPEKVWEALTSGEFTQQYWAGRRIQSDWQAGSPVRLVKEDGGLDWHGEVLAAEPPKLLSYTFNVDDDDCECEFSEHDTQAGLATEKASRVTLELTPMNKQVKLTVTHDQFEPGSAVLKGVSQGWPGILSNLKTLLETGQAMPSGKG